MEKAHRVILIFFIVAIIAVGSLYGYYLVKKNSTNILFYGNTCHYCKEVDEFIKANNDTIKTEFIFKEIENNQKNGEQLKAVALSCGIKSDIKIPFVYSKGECYEGRDEVIEFLNKTMGDNN